MDQILGHNARLNKYKKIEITPCILSGHNAIKLEINKGNSRKYSNTWRQNNTLLQCQCVIKDIREEIKSSWNVMRMKTQPFRIFGTE
jgi:hypothetical protein